MPKPLDSILCLFLGGLFLLPLWPTQGYGQEDSKRQLQRLAVQLQNGREKEQIQAALDLGRMGNAATPTLIEALHRNQNSEVLDGIATAFGLIGKEAVPPLISTLANEVEGASDIKVVRYTTNALKNIAMKRENLNPEFKKAVPSLIEILNKRSHLERKGAGDCKLELDTAADCLARNGAGKCEVEIRLEEDCLAKKGASNYELQDFDAAADCLAYIGKDAKDAVPLLIDLSSNEKYRQEAQHYRKKDSVVAIIRDLKIHSDFSANESIRAAFEKHKDALDPADKVEIAEWIDELETAAQLQKFKRLFLWGGIFREYPKISAIGVSFLSIALLWLMTLLLKPIWLLQIYQNLPVPEARLTGVLGTITVPLQRLARACMLRPRVLDAWVKKYFSKVRDRFSNKQTVQDRKIHVPISLLLNRQPVPEFKLREALEKTFTRNQSRVLIAGSGGVGKTSLACQIAHWGMREENFEGLCKHAMLPVLLEDNFGGNDKEALNKAISSQLRDSLDATTQISAELVQALLENKRLLILIDGMSEMNEETRHAILEGIQTIPVNAVVFTSRTEETIDHLSRTTIIPTTIKRNQLASFVAAYLTSLGKMEGFEDEEYFEGCRLLSTIVGDRSITVLLAKLFVEQMVAKQDNPLENDLPGSIPELMLRSIEILHAKASSSKLALPDVLNAAEVIAWQCLKSDFRPLAADYNDVKKALINSSSGEACLGYLKDNLKLIETVSFGKRIKFKIDPLAEYLAGIYLVEQNNGNEEKWNAFFDHIMSKTGSVENIRSFLLAVRDCCRAADAAAGVPPFVIEKLTKMTSAD